MMQGVVNILSTHLAMRGHDSVEEQLHSGYCKVGKAQFQRLGWTLGTKRPLFLASKIGHVKSFVQMKTCF